MAGLDVQAQSSGSAAELLPSLRQVIRQFDFDDPEAAPNSLPVPFYRFVSPHQGLPPFGFTRLTRQVAFNGIGSLEFELGGGSMSVRLPTAAVPILPLSDYSVSVQVRSEGLKRARARLGAWLTDQQGAIIENSRTFSDLAHAADDWELLHVELRGRWPEAADLIVELQVLQPAQYAPGPAQPHQPQLEDVTGRVWFDALRIMHLPRITMHLQQPLHVLAQPQAPSFEVLVRELTGHELSARLRVVDALGNVRHDVTSPAPRGEHPGVFRVPLDQCNWYRATLDVISGGSARQQQVNFAIVPNEGASTGTNARFGVCLVPDALTDGDEAARLVQALQCGWAIVPIWSELPQHRATDDASAGLQPTIGALLDQDVSLIFALSAASRELAQQAGVTERDVLGVLSQNPAIWQASLDQLLVNYGLEVNRWLLGSFDRPEAFWSPQVHDAAARAQAALGQFIPRPLLYIAWSADQQAMAQTDASRGFAINLPHEINPAAIDAYLRAFSGSPTVVRLEMLPEDSFNWVQRLADLFHRGLYAWRCESPVVVIDSPWRRHESGGRVSLQPQPEFTIWRTLCMQLHQHTFAGELDMGPGINCWMLQGRDSLDSMLVAWSDSVHAGAARQIRTQLAAGPVRVSDAFGNASSVAPSHGVHTINLTELPVFIHHVNLPLVTFRSAARIEPEFVDAVSKLHEHEIVLQNPFEVTVSGTIRLRETDQWKLAPLAQEFTIAPGETVRLPLTIIPQRSILAGPKRVPAVISLSADRGYEVETDLALEIGLRNIDFKASWTTARNARTGDLDLVITQIITNNGTSIVRLEAYVLAEGLGQNRKIIGSLHPGQTTVRQFHIPNGAVTLAGSQVRIGVMEHDGVARLNRILHITPSSPAGTIATVQESASDH